MADAHAVPCKRLWTVMGHAGVLLLVGELRKAYTVGVVWNRFFSHPEEGLVEPSFSAKYFWTFAS